MTLPESNDILTVEAVAVLKAPKTNRLPSPFAMTAVLIVCEIDNRMAPRYGIAKALVCPICLCK